MYASPNALLLATSARQFSEYLSMLVLLTFVFIEHVDMMIAASGLSSAFEDRHDALLELLELVVRRTPDDIGDRGPVRDDIGRLIFLEFDKSMNTLVWLDLLSQHRDVVVN